MARLKNTKNVDVEEKQEAEVVHSPNQTSETSDVKGVVTEPEEMAQPDESTLKSDATASDSKKDESTVEIPEFVQKILASYPNYSALYVDTKGGAYPSDTQPNLVSDAILYQNPYYK